MGRIIYSDGRTALTTTAFRYKLTDSAGTLVKDWTTGATWTEEPAGTYYLDDAAAVPGTRYAVEPATGEVGGAGMVPEPMRGTDGANTVAPDNATIAAIALKAASLTDATGTLPIEFTLLLDVDGDGADVPAVPIADARCIVYADEALTTPLSEARNTDTAGYVRWDGYAAGTYWVKPDKAGYRFTAVEVTVA